MSDSIARIPDYDPSDFNASIAEVLSLCGGPSTVTITSRLDTARAPFPAATGGWLVVQSSPNGRGAHLCVIHPDEGKACVEVDHVIQLRGTTAFFRDNAAGAARWVKDNRGPRHRARFECPSAEIPLTVAA